MKLFKTLKTTLLLAITSVALFSCNPTPQQGPVANHFTFSGNTYQIDAATITYDGTEKFLVFYGPGISTNATMTEFIGTGNALSFSIHSTAVAGMYTFSAAASPALGSFEDSEFGIGLNAPSGGGIFEGEFNTGTIEIQPVSSGGFTVTIIDPTVNMTFEGPLQVGNFH